MVFVVELVAWGWSVVLGYGTDCKPGLTRGFPDVATSFFVKNVLGLVG